MSTIAAVLAFLMLDEPWRFIVPALLVVLDVFEILIWLRWRKRRSTTGAEGLVGRRAVAITDLRPDGQVRLDGRVWKALAAGEVDAGAPVEVMGVDGLTLRVVPAKLSSEPTAAVVARED